MPLPAAIIGIGVIVKTGLDIALDVITSDEFRNTLNSIKRNYPELSPITDQLLSVSSTLEPFRTPPTFDELRQYYTNAVQSYDNWKTASENHLNAIERVRSIRNRLNSAKSRSRASLKRQLRNAVRRELLARRTEESNQSMFNDDLFALIIQSAAFGRDRVNFARDIQKFFKKLSRN